MGDRWRIGVIIRLIPAVKKCAAPPIIPSSATYKPVNDPHKDDIDDLMADINEDERIQFLTKIKAEIGQVVRPSSPTLSCWHSSEGSYQVCCCPVYLYILT